MEALEIPIQTTARQNLTLTPETGAETELLLTSIPLDNIAHEAVMEDYTATVDVAPIRNLERPKSRGRKALGAVGLTVGMSGALFAATACDPIDYIPGTNNTVRQHYIDNTGITRIGEGPERLAEGEAAADPEAAGLTVHNGDYHVYTDGANLSRMAIFGCLGIHADNVVIHDVYIESDHACVGGDYPHGQSIVNTGFHQDNPDGSGAHNLVIYDSEINGMGTTEDIAAIGQDGWKAFNVRIYGSVKGVRADHDNVLWHSAIYNLSSSVVHGEGVFIAGGPGNIAGGTANILLTGNYIEANASTGAIALLNNYDASNITIENNYLNGNGGAGITGGAYKDKPGNYFFNVVVRNNIIDDDSTPETGAFCKDCPGNEWTNNKTEKGVLVGPGSPWRQDEPYDPPNIPAS